MAGRKQTQNKFYIHAYQATGFIKARPLTSFFLVLFILLILIITGSFLAVKKPEPGKREITKNVQTYQIGENPKVTLQAKIEKSGVIKISALAPGIIQSINFFEGDQVQKGTVLINISSNYQGGNAASVQRQIAQKQYQNTKDAFDSQKDIIKNQRDLAEKSQDNAAQLRDITNQSLQETRDLIDLNQSIINTLSQNQKNLEQNNPGGVNDTAILQLKSQKAGIQTGLNQLRSSLRQAEFQSWGDKPPAELARLQRDVALKQLDLQQRSLELGLEISRLQLIIAQISEAFFFPASPFAATVQRVYVKVGQSVTPGTPLLTISAVEDSITAIVSLPQNLAGAVSSTEPSILHINDQNIDLNPHFISTEATDGTLYSMIYIIPDQFSKDLTAGATIAVEVPIGLQTNSAIPFIPLDGVYQSADKSTVLVAENGLAVSRIIEPGSVFGRFVEVKSGLSQNDQVILNRNVLAGDRVFIQK